MITHNNGIYFIKKIQLMFWVSSIFFVSDLDLISFGDKKKCFKHSTSKDFCLGASWSLLVLFLDHLLALICFLYGRVVVWLTHSPFPFFILIVPKLYEQGAFTWYWSRKFKQDIFIHNSQTTFWKTFQDGDKRRSVFFSIRLPISLIFHITNPTGTV